MFALMTVRTHHQCMYAVTVAQFPHEHRLVFAVIEVAYYTTRHQSVAILVVALSYPSELCWYAMIMLMWLC